MTPPNTCLDAETLAAWADGGLSRNDAAMAEAHVSSCPRCQEIAGLIVKTTPATSAVPAWWRVRPSWLIPAAVGVAAVGLFMIAPATPVPSPEPPAATAKLESAQSANAVAPAVPPVAPSVEARKEKPREAIANAAADAAAAPVEAAPPAAAAGRLADQQAVRERAAPAAAKEAVSPDGALHWRITDRGALQRSTDGGSTWQAVKIETATAFTSVRAPESRTALVTTIDGRVFRTSDGGATWRMQEN